MKINLKPNKEGGITLVALIITIIILVILAAVSIKAVYDSKIVGYASNAAGDYLTESQKEEKLLNDTERFLASIKNGSNVGGTVGAGADYETLINKINELESNQLVLQGQIESLQNSTLKLDDIYPIGSIYITEELATAQEVSAKFGGTWESYGEGRTLVGAGTGTDSNSESKTFAAGEQGGEYNHNLTANEMPSHTHTRGTMNITGNVFFRPFAKSRILWCRYCLLCFFFEECFYWCRRMLCYYLQYEFLSYAKFEFQCGGRLDW